jgi:hypothetical protein
MDTRTVAVPDAITAFAVPNPGVSSQIRRFFRVWSSSESPRSRITQPTSDWQLLLKPTLSAVDVLQLSPFREVVNARFLCK